MDSQHLDPSGNFTLEVENFGPIVRASVDLRPLTIFVGPSNTGKSYLAILAYALHKCFGPGRVSRYGRQRGYSLRSLELGDVPSMDWQEWLRDLQEWLSALPEDNASPPLPPDLGEPLRPALEQTGSIDRYLAAEMTRCFGVEHHRDLIRQAGSRQGARVTLKIPRYIGGALVSGDDIGPDPVRYHFDFASDRKRTAAGSISDNAPIRIRPEYLDELRENVLPRISHFDRNLDVDSVYAAGELRYFVGQVVQSLLLSLFHPLNSSAFYLPASRTGVMHSHQTVVSALIQSATAAGRRPTARVPVLSGVLADFLDDLFALSGRPSQDRLMFTQRLRQEGRGARRQFEELANLLEENVLKGSIELDSGEPNYPIFSYRPTGWKNELPLMRTSSMVSELAPVVLYLRYLVQPGDLLIIEEPESHLHPAMQSVFARELARLVHSGVRVLLTTHSEWFLEQIGNLVKLSDLPERKRSGIPGGDVALRQEQVGAWLFTPKLRPRGSVVEEIGLEEETGLYPAGYDEVSDALYNESAEIFNRLQAGRPE